VPKCYKKGAKLVVSLAEFCMGGCEAEESQLATAGEETAGWEKA
jgi:hypothetical protein